MFKKNITIYYGGFLYKAGGVTSHAMTLEKTLVKMGHNVTVISLESLPIWSKYIPHLIEKTVNFVNRPIGFLYKGYATKALFKLFFNGTTDFRIFEDIYIAWDSTIPSATILHAVWSDNLQSFFVSDKQQAKLQMHEANIINSIKHRIATVSYPYKEYIVNDCFKNSLSKKIEVVELGVEQSNFSEINHLNNKSIVYLGALEARKNILFLLKVFKKISQQDSNYTLTIIGDGPDKNKLVEFVNNNNLNVNFLGRLTHAAALLELPKHNIYLHTSTKESFSYSLLEAKLSGLITCAYAMLQVPSDFIDVAMTSFEENEWSDAILNINWVPEKFNGLNYTAEKMTLKTLELTQ